MIKFILTAGIIYFIVRWIMIKPASKEQITHQRPPEVKQNPEPQDGEYVDYEEVD